MNHEHEKCKDVVSMGKHGNVESITTEESRREKSPIVKRTTMKEEEGWGGGGIGGASNSAKIGIIDHRGETCALMKNVKCKGAPL